MTMLQKIIDCKCLDNSQENVYDRVCVSKYASLQNTNYNSTINRLQHVFRKVAASKKVF